jgi:hypothetical protein
VFAWRLGETWLNIAEVVFADEVDDATWSDGRPFVEQNDSSLVLVRIAQDYLPDDLPIQDLDRAIAAELVFSMWIRRRDAHPWNRAYVSGIPIFFDHHIAFGAQAANLLISSFFRVGADGGHAGRWRVKPLPAAETPTTSGEREFSGGAMAIHRVRDLSAFDALLVETADAIRKRDRTELEQRAHLSRVRQPEALLTFLTLGQERLDDELAELQTVLWSDESF